MPHDFSTPRMARRVGPQLRRSVFSICLGLLALLAAAGARAAVLRERGQAAAAVVGEAGASATGADAEAPHGLASSLVAGGRARPRRVLRRQAKCPFNFAGMDYLCPVATSPASTAQLGSSNGMWAFLMDSGRPRIVSFSGGWKTPWAMPDKRFLPTGCAKFTTAFETSGDIVFRCNGVPKAKLVINNAGQRPKRMWIDNAGVVRFASATSVTILTISPKTGPSPASALTMVPWTGTSTPVKTTAAPARASTAPVPPPAPPVSMTSLKLSTRNRIVKPGCRYVPVPFPSYKQPAKTFNIELIACGVTGARAAAIDAVFVKAAQKWMSVITGDLLDLETNPGEEIPCLTDWDGNPILNCGLVDDLVIAYVVSPIDGEGRILGSAGPVFTRTRDWPSSRFLPIAGFMQFDSADFDKLSATGQDYFVVLHEMGHVLGFGTIWTDMNLLNPKNCDTLAGGPEPVPNVKFTGPNAVKGMTAVKLSAIQPQVEGEGGQGTACAHWSESRFTKELMTGWIQPEGGNPLSALTANAMKDLGYTVDLASSAIDPFDATPPSGSHAVVDPDEAGYTKTGEGWKKRKPGGISFGATGGGRRRRELGLPDSWDLVNVARSEAGNLVADEEASA